MALLVWISVVVAVSLLWRRHAQYRAYQQAATLRGCRPAARYWHRDPFLGLDTLFGTIYGVVRNTNLLTLKRRLDIYGSTFETETLETRTFWSKDPELIRTVWSTHEKDWGNEPFRLAPMEPFCGLGFITADGATWEHSRALLKPTFAKSNISDLSFVDAAATALVERIPHDGSPIDLQSLLYTMYLDMATQFLLGRSMGAFLGDEPADTPVQVDVFLTEFQNSLQGTGLRIISGGLRDLLPRAAWDRSCSVVHRFLEHFADAAIARRTDSSSNETAAAASPKRYQSLLEGLVRQTDDHVEIRNHLIQAMMAAQDTTSVLIANALYLLARHADIWRRVRAEAQRLESVGFTYGNLMSSELLHNVLMETLRLYPIFSNLARAALRDTILPTGGGADGKSPIFVPKGSVFNGVFYALHREEAIYGQRVEAFEPDRWQSIKPGPFDFMAFGQGRRACLGQQKAQMEAAYIICRIALAFEQLIPDATGYAAAERITTRNAHGCVLKFVPARTSDSLA